MTIRLIGAAAAIALMSSAAWAQSPAPRTGNAANDASPSATMTGPGTAGTQRSTGTEDNVRGGMASVDRLMGKDVIGRDDEKLGEVEDVILGPDGQARKLVLARGGFLGMNEKQVAIDFNLVQSRPDDDDLHVSSLSRDDVRNMAEFQYEDGMTSLNRSRTGSGAAPADGAAPSATPDAPPAPGAAGSTPAR
ncbi:PRC-barrel domain-containing protein [Azospirillum sp. RWY-5-1]|uniref:PRC-barrel domain-containing protein n=1 Tax=Azospirillum oleiclasticum TaxID=2735135 RepID=A0ABX2TB55_9PROT|nr:PRC-barrel domain-containing protein [Azospirillum oleiclasticum]NYZ15165.1 PRC-barrel domain-containing protein [Azospirillum oleiclasticum]NYZ21414.1 PRC-barrel domain-containing protein [Azospirillum oleiclasticum]